MAGREIPTLEQLKEMADVDIRTVDKESLVSIENVRIRTGLPDRDRLRDYIQQIKNPYCYLANGIIIKISFAGKDTLEECLGRCILTEKNDKKRKKG